MNRDTVLLEPVPPFRLDLTVWTLRRRPDNAVDRWDGLTYRRILPMPSGPVEVAVTQVGPPDAPVLRALIEGQPLRAPLEASVVSALERLLGLRIDLTDFHRFAARQGPLAPLAKRFHGMKPPRFATAFESVVNAIACQQVTLTLGIRLLNRLTERHGLALPRSDGAAHAFPRPEELANLRPEGFRQLGFSRQKGQAMIELSRAIVEGRLDLDELSKLSDEEALERLLGLRGVGRWTAEYVLLRGLGRTHIFPGDDVGARNNLQRWLQLTESLDYDGVQQTLARWRRFGGLIYFHLLLDGLDRADHLRIGPSKLADGPLNEKERTRDVEEAGQSPRRRRAERKSSLVVTAPALESRQPAGPVDRDLVDEANEGPPPTTGVPGPDVASDKGSSSSRPTPREAPRPGDCVCIPDGRIGRVRDVTAGKCRVRVRRKTSETHQFLTFPAEELKPADCPKGWMSPEGYLRYLEVTLTKMRQRQARAGGKQ